MLLRKNGIGILIFITIALCTMLSNAQDITMATGEWVPYTSADLENYGRFTERVNTVFKEMGIKPEYVFYPWTRCFDSVVKGRVWAAFPYSYTRERAEKVWYSDTLSCSRTVFFYYNGKNPSRQYHFNSLEDLKAYKIGGIIGYFYEEIFRNAGLEIDYVSRENYALEKLKMGRIDLMPVNEMVGWHLIETCCPDDIHAFKTLDRPLSINPLSLIVSKDYPESKKILDRFNTCLKRCIEKGLINIENCN